MYLCICVSFPCWMCFFLCVYSSCVSMFAYISVICGFHGILYVSCFVLSCFFQLYMLFSLN